MDAARASLRATKVGTQHVLDEGDLDAMLASSSDTVPLPPAWQKTFWGGPMPDFVAIVRRQRTDH